MNLTIALIAGRREPHVDWIREDLYTQRQPEDIIDLLVIDGCYDHELRDDVQGAMGVTERYARPKPTIWQGPQRITQDNWWAKSNAANTALVLAYHDHIAFVDDCCHLAPTWLEAVRQSASAGTTIAGSYSKLERGQVTKDGRLAIAPNGKINCGGGWMYGCTFALPLAHALEVNGFEEGVDGMGGEDYLFGLMLQNAGHRIDYVPEMAVIQERPDVSDGTGGVYKRCDKGVSPFDKSHAALARFGKRKRTEFTPDLMELRRANPVTTQRVYSWPPMAPDPTLYRDWFDGQLIMHMT